MSVLLARSVAQNCFAAFALLVRWFRSFALYLLLPVYAITAALLLEYSGFDLLLSQFFYDSASHSWPLKSNWLTSDLIHTGGRYFSVIALLLAALGLAFSYLGRQRHRWRKPLAYSVLSWISGPSLVAIGKHSTHIYSPWDLQLFGGSQPYIRILDATPTDALVGLSFPAGHASAGYMFVSFYFLARHYFPRLQYPALAFGLLMGLIYGIAQQMRGAHFLSHDMFSLAICWCAALFWNQVIFKPNLREPTNYAN